jgi:rRNA maturation endonuclease Nob1
LFELVAQDDTRLATLTVGYLSLQGEAVEAMGKMELASTCPACKHVYDGIEEQLCPSCGSSRPMVEVKA